jgi:hypothetical protein
LLVSISGVPVVVSVVVVSPKRLVNHEVTSIPSNPSDIFPRALNKSVPFVETPSPTVFKFVVRVDPCVDTPSPAVPKFAVNADPAV